MFVCRIPTGGKDLSWQHPHFQRNDTSQLCLIKRTALKGGWPKRKKLVKIAQGGPIQAEDDTAPRQPFSCTSMTGIAGLGYTGPTNLQALSAAPKLPDMNNFLVGRVDSSSYAPHDLLTNTYRESLGTSFNNSNQARDLDYSVVSSEESIRQSHHCRAFPNKSFPRDTPVDGFTFNSPISKDDIVPFQAPSPVVSKCSNSPIFQDDIAPFQDPAPVVTKCSVTNPTKKATAYAGMINNEGFGIGDDRYVLSSLQENSSFLSDSDEEFDHELQSLFPKVENAKQANMTVDSNEQERSGADVSDIDFKAFMLKYFPSS